MDFKEKLNNILLESEIKVSSEDITDAINNKYRVLINYDDEKENAPTGTRLIEPYVYGMTRANNPCIRAWQWSGSTRRGVPKYKMFRIDRILNWNPKPNDHFYAEPKKLAVLAPDYNEDGDEGMSMIFAQVQFTNKDSKETQDSDSTEWQSPLDKVRQNRIRQNQEIDDRINHQQDKEGAINTKELNKDLNQDKTQLERNLDKTLEVDNISNVKRGAIKINPNIYDRNNKSQQQKQDTDTLRKREKRWQNAVNTRPLYRKDSLNNDLRQNLNQALDIEDDGNEIENNE